MISAGPVHEVLQSKARSEPEARTHILDRQNPSNKAWQAARISGVNPTFTDYAIVSRILDPAIRSAGCGVVAGIHSVWGLPTAADFLSNSGEEKWCWTAHAPRDWRRKNMQAVLAMDVKDGKPAGPIRVPASYFW